ncbi:MAG: molybdate ABC transporter substrate-binding protein [Cucumibacter sp.]
MPLRVLLPVVLFAAFADPSAAHAQARVMAAASLVDVLAALAEDFTVTTGLTVTIGADSSSTLARQIEAGAPAGLFISANREWADYMVEKANYAVPVRFAGNALVVIGRDGAAPLATLASLPEALGEGRLALGDPEHVPAGTYAKAALVKTGLWESLADRVAPADNVRAAVLLVETGSSPYGIVYSTDAQFPGVTRVLDIDPSLYPPVVYWMALATDAADADRAFFDYLTTDAAHAILGAGGFLP